MGTKHKKISFIQLISYGKKLLTGIPRASGLTGTLKGSAASIFITFLIICVEQTEWIIITDNVMLGNSKQNQEEQLYQNSNKPLRKHPIPAYYIEHYVEWPFFLLGG